MVTPKRFMTAKAGSWFLLIGARAGGVKNIQCGQKKQEVAPNKKESRELIKPSPITNIPHTHNQQLWISRVIDMHNSRHRHIR